MQMDSNIDINDAVYNTNAPFEAGEPLNIGGLTLSNNNFRSIRVYCKEGDALPVRLASLAYDKKYPDRAFVGFEAANGSTIGKWEVVPVMAGTTGDYISNFILNDVDTIVGHIVYYKELPAALISLAKSSGGTIRTKGTAFKLLPQCHIPVFTGQAKAFKVGDQIYRTALKVTDADNIKVQNSDGLCSLGWDSSTLQTQSKSNGICKLKVDNLVSINNTAITAGSADNNEFWIGGSHLIIRSSVTSNLRVTVEGEALNFRGVKE